MPNIYKEILNLSESRIDEHLNRNDVGCIGSEVHKKWFLGEVEEAMEELKDNNSVYLEDELGDVFWTFCNVLNTLEKEGKITGVDKVFERALKKFSQRIEYSRKSEKKVGVWDDIKKVQKQERLKEHNAKYGK